MSSFGSSTRPPGAGRAVFVILLAVLQLTVGFGAEAGVRVRRARSPKAPPLDCAAALLVLQDQLGEIEADDHFDSSKPHEATVRELGSRDGEHGDRILTLLKIGSRWSSEYRTVRFDPQGDPRWFVAMVGADAARFFGFRKSKFTSR